MLVKVDIGIVEGALFMDLVQEPSGIPDVAEGLLLIWSRCSS